MFPTTWFSLTFFSFLFSCNFLTVFNDGTAKTLVCLTGTIKVFFNGKLDHKDKWTYFPVVLQSRNVLCSKKNTSTLCALGKLYNIPVGLWLKESYPRTAPICYLKPTREMVVVTSKHVNSNGEILMPYLDEWRYVRLQLEDATMVFACHYTNDLQFSVCLGIYLQPQCDLHGLIQVMMTVFSEIPPLRMCLDLEDCEYSFPVYSLHPIHFSHVNRAGNR